MRRLAHNLIATAAIFGALAAVPVSMAVPAIAHDYTAGTLMIDHPWARPAIPNRPGVVFLTVKNTGETADRLIAASTPVAGTVEIHTHIKDGDVMRMVRIEGIDVPAGGMAMLQPGGDHLMLFDIPAPYAVGDSFPMTLTFEKAGDVAVEVQVEMGQDGAGHSMHNMPAHGGHGQGHGAAKMPMKTN
ncbi:copper chaperone PCu(A)C [Futiania mangrovi]|uniref:Copper chaperone PCu(A)C n=1 Tax=Futiania mangrovi TaxID=2959716 RepID=A0A9J6PBG0_9PROT|nr:copper chaperone PCu(A)C [Futiania mangrovii]MCP1336541.1 copper chaperone PCu(A)C [Futiania mangrovii]